MWHLFCYTLSINPEGSKGKELVTSQYSPPPPSPFSLEGQRERSEVSRAHRLTEAVPAAGSPIGDEAAAGREAPQAGSKGEKHLGFFPSIPIGSTQLNWGPGGGVCVGGKEPGLVSQCE